jgi:hypothetical protein
LAVLTACTRVTQVKGPDGEDANLISCRNSEDCYAKARELCPSGYVIRTSSTMPGGAMDPSAAEILVSCKDDIPSRTAVTSASTEKNADADRDDARVCEAASRHVDGFKSYWGSKAASTKLLAEMPEKRDFVTACRALPENAQRCMHDKYRAAHAKACDAVLTRLEAADRRRIDALFLEAE